nr:ABC transporter ATP-binding protein [Methanobrevibacter sp.]
MEVNIMDTIIEFKNVNKHYQSGEHIVKAIDDISFTIDEGEFVIILGPSGAGKSTLLNLLGGMDTVTSGQIIVDGRNIESFDDNQLTEYRAKNVGFIFQFYNLIPNLTALENVELMKDIVDVDIEGEDVLDSVGLKKRANQFPAQLSGGEQQRVSIARAVAKQPTMLLCDEPTGALDSNTGVLILNLLQDMSNNKNTTVVIVTHNAVLAEAADKVIRIKNGQIESIVINENPKKIDDLEW